MRYFSWLFGALGSISRPRPFLDVFLSTCFQFAFKFLLCTYSCRSRQIFLSSCLDVELYHRDRGGGGAGRAAAPPLFASPLPLFALKRRIIKIKKRLETNFFRLYSDIFSVFSLILNARHFVGLLCFSR